ncbi:RNA polymerase sigma factor [Paenibacillus puerhi]|uniref:RNA polymerase sigma factor n=1 Tax=Paenibacillus puerhi TaxID=2692622 RepID=UPI00135942D3|nr:RNA polymerase sigma factor [Paenibacillus puerhi]
MVIRAEHTASITQAERQAAAQAELDKALVERAQLGDTEAFGELIEQHRTKARGWAERMTGDPHLADDVVQDALIRAFMHLGTLADTSRFLPWLYRIVRNQANMRLRRGGGPTRKEKSFSSMGAAAQADGSRVDWEDLDSILYHLARKAADEAADAQDPAENLLRKEMYETIHALISCLTPKERGIFHAYFFQQLSPAEIASMYRMTVGSIYTYIHRSRQKLRQEHIRVSLGLSLEKGGSGLTGKKIVQLTDWQAASPLQISLVNSIGRLLASLGDSREAAYVMGVSGFAFRMKISDQTTFADGIYMFDWKRTVQSLMEELGYRVTMLLGQLSESPIPLLGAVERFPVVLPIEEAVMPFIRKYVDLGRPVLYFDTLTAKPYVHEWALIYGYDDAQRIVYLTDPMHPEGKALSYDDVTDNPVRFVVGIDGALKAQKAHPPVRPGSKQRLQAVRAIRFAVDYARNGCSYQPNTVYLRYTSGLAAYDRWISHLRSDHIVPNRYGMGQLALTNAEAKRYASHYLRSVPLEGEAMRLTLLASEAYEEAAEALESLSGEVPFIRTSEMLSPEREEACALLLEQAKAFETAAIGYLEKALALLEVPL